jgi:hypothetical protein
MVAPLVGNFNLDSYVVGKALDGLFYMLGQEEQQIRTNPAAQKRPCSKKSSARNRIRGERTSCRVQVARKILQSRIHRDGDDGVSRTQFLSELQRRSNIQSS